MFKKMVNLQELKKASREVPLVNLPVRKENALLLQLKQSDCGLRTVYSKDQQPHLPFANSSLFYSKISDWRRLCAASGKCKAMYEVTFDVSDSNFSFKAGDTIGVIPENKRSEVEDVITHLELESVADLPYVLSIDSTVKGVKIPAHIPIESTIRYVITTCVELRSVMKKLFLLALSQHTKNDVERKVLEFLCSKEGSAIYKSHILNDNICILDIFSVFKSCKPPVEVLFSHLPRLLPRPYSVVNTGLQDPNKIKICFSVMHLGNNRKGLTTSWLEDMILDQESSIVKNIEKLNLGDHDNERKCYESDLETKIPIYIRKNITEFCLPEDIKTPLILIGTGSGVAPFLGFLEERQFLIETKTLNRVIDVGYVHLFFGCRDPKLDLIYEEEWKEFSKKGVLNKMSVSFSQIDHNGPKYVQDALKDHAREVVNLILDGAAIYVCGDLKNMVKTVREIIVKCLIEQCGKSVDEAESHINYMEKKKLYVVDNWS